MPWAAAFVLGAIVSPTDPVAAATIMRRLDAPRQSVSAVEGEGLFNDASAPGHRHRRHLHGHPQPGNTRRPATAAKEIRARLGASKAALAQIDELAGEEWTRDDTAQRMRGMYEYRAQRFAARLGKVEDGGYEDRSRSYQQMVRLVLQAQRDALIQMRRDGKLSNEAMNTILRELDLEESRLEI